MSLVNKELCNYICNIIHTFLFDIKLNIEYNKNKKSHNNNNFNSLIKKKLYKLFANNLYNNLGTDHYIKIQTNNKLALKNILNEINENNNINIKDPLLYNIRIWNGYSNKYSIKIGYTENFSQRLIDINNRYDCYWRIFIIVCANINTINIEKEIHNELSKKHEKSNIGNPIKNKPKELYIISFSLYDDFVKIIERNKLKYFESENYLFEENNNEKIYDDQIDNDNIILKDNDNYIYLDQNINESKYWLHKYKNILK